jgi:GT2 family glycosyltransferase
LRRQTAEHDIVVVDNGSTDHTSRLLAQHYPEVTVVRLSENAGFGRAVNRGVAASRSGTIVLVNNDVVCEPTFVERLCAAIDPARGFVMAAGVLLDAERPSRVDSAGIMFDTTLLAFDYLSGEPVDILRPELPDPLGPCGGAAAFDRDAFDAVGGFDEAFFAYLEDVDLAVRLLARGGRCRLASGARCLHRHSATLGSASARKNALMGWSRGYILAKYRMHRQPRRFLRAAVGEVVIVSGQTIVDRTLTGVAARVEGFRTGLHAPSAEIPPLPVIAARQRLGRVLWSRYQGRCRRRRPQQATRAPHG